MCRDAGHLPTGGNVAMYGWDDGGVLRHVPPSISGWKFELEVHSKNSVTTDIEFEFEYLMKTNAIKCNHNLIIFGSAEHRDNSAVILPSTKINCDTVIYIGKPRRGMDIMSNYYESFYFTLCWNVTNEKSKKNRIGMTAVGPSCSPTRNTNPVNPLRCKPSSWSSATLLLTTVHSLSRASFHTFRVMIISLKYLRCTSQADNNLWW